MEKKFYAHSLEGKPPSEWQPFELVRDLANLYRVETRLLNQAVHRNLDRFPSDFMFELTNLQFENLRSQNLTLERSLHSKHSLSFYDSKH